MSGYEIFFISGSPPCWRVMLAMEVKGLDYTATRFDNAKGDQKNPEFLKINPRGHVPVLRNGETVVCESLAILAYLDRAHRVPALFGESAAEAGAIWQQILQFDDVMPGPIRSVTRPIFRGKAEEQADAVRAAADTLRPELKALDRRLGDTPYLAGAGLSAADIALYPPLMQLMRAAGRDEAVALGLELAPLRDTFSAIARWCERIEAIPGYERAYPPHWR
jgi:glutathione S-transferase